MMASLFLASFTRSNVLVSPVTTAGWALSAGLGVDVLDELRQNTKRRLESNKTNQKRLRNRRRRRQKQLRR